MLSWRELVYLSQELDERNTETKQLWSTSSAIQVGRMIGSRLSMHPKASACQPFVLTSGLPQIFDGPKGVDRDNHAHNLGYIQVQVYSCMHLRSFWRTSFPKV